MKIKVMAASDMLMLERAVNDFIADKKVIDIKYQSFMFPTEYSNYMPKSIEREDRVIIMYEEQNEKD